VDEAGGGGIAHAREHISNWIRNSAHNDLPARFDDTGNLALGSHLPETDAAHLKFTHIAAATPATAATTHRA